MNDSNFQIQGSSFGVSSAGGTISRIAYNPPDAPCNLHLKPSNSRNSFWIAFPRELPPSICRQGSHTSVTDLRGADAGLPDPPLFQRRPRTAPRRRRPPGALGWRRWRLPLDALGQAWLLLQVGGPPPEGAQRRLGHCGKLGALWLHACNLWMFRGSHTQTRTPTQADHALLCHSVDVHQMKRLK